MEGDGEEHPRRGGLAHPVRPRALRRGRQQQQSRGRGGAREKRTEGEGGELHESSQREKPTAPAGRTGTAAVEPQEQRRRRRHGAAIYFLRLPGIDRFIFRGRGGALLFALLFSLEVVVRSCGMGMGAAVLVGHLSLVKIRLR